MLEQKPYLVRAIYEWIADSGYTPYMQVAVNYPGVDVPVGFDDKGVLVLNVSRQATNQLTMAKDGISFVARFRGQPMGVTVPYPAVLAIFAKENGEGMGFDVPEVRLPPQLSVVSSNKDKEADTPDNTQKSASAEPTQKSEKRDRSHLRVVK
jgi:stringent starvation protein B